MNRRPPQTEQSNDAAVAATGSLRLLVIAAASLALCFAVPLYQLAKFSVHSDLYSHVLLMPLLSIYIIWSNRSKLPRRSPPDYAVGGFFAIAGAVTLGYALVSVPSVPVEAVENYLSGRVLALVFFLNAAAALVLGRQIFRALMFPLGFLVFMVPLSTGMLDRVEFFLQHGSAQVALILFRLTGTSVYYENLVIQLRGIAPLRVAPECSGIHASLALLITSVVAGHFFLPSRWKCVVLILAIIPLSLIRNGFRIFTIGELCVHVGPEMIDSYIHRQGGPIFFALSLIPFFFLLRFLHKSKPAR